MLKNLSPQKPRKNLRRKKSCCIFQQQQIIEYTQQINMTVTPKFKVGQKVWTMLGQDYFVKPTELEIERIVINLDGEEQSPRILCHFRKSSQDRETHSCLESFFAATKGELINKFFP